MIRIIMFVAIPVFAGWGRLPPRRPPVLSSAQLPAIGYRNRGPQASFFFTGMAGLWPCHSSSSVSG